MPKEPTKPLLNIDLLKPQGTPQKIGVKVIKWVLSAGRYIIIFVEFVVLATFLTRFKIDADISNIKDGIAQIAPYIESIRPTEVLIKKTQFQLSTIKEIKKTSPDFVEILDKIASQTPAGVSLSNINLEIIENKIIVKITGISKNNLELSTFVYGLRNDKNFQDINISNIDLEEGDLNFSIIGNYSK